MKQFAVASYALYFLSGMVITTIGSVLPQLLAHYDLSYTIGGQLVFMGSIGFLLGVPFSYVLMNRLGEKALLSIAATFLAIGQFGILFLPYFGWVLFFNFVSNFGVAVFETLVATLMMEVFVGRRAVVMSYLEVSFGLGALLMPLISSIFIAHDMWKFSFLVTGVLSILMVIVWQMISYSKESVDFSKSLDASTDSPPQISSKRAKWVLLSIFVFMIFLYTGIEGSLNNFLSSIFITFLGAVPYYAAISIGIFWTAMVIGRIATGWIIRKVTYSQFLMWSMALTFAGLICFILLKNIVAGFALVGFLGLTMSGIYSITMVYANHTFPGLARLVTSLVTGFAGLGSAAFPALIGYTMDHSSIAAALWFVTAFSGIYILSLLTILVIHRKLSRANHVIEKRHVT